MAIQQNFGRRFGRLVKNRCFDQIGYSLESKYRNHTSLWKWRALEVDRLEVVVEDLYDLVLGEACKAEGEALNLLGDLTCNIIFLR